MKDLFTKFTFGFLMAQFLPGAVGVVLFTSPLAARSGEWESLTLFAGQVGGYWTNSVTSTIVFLFLSLGLGMLIHGLQWTVLAYLEHVYPENKSILECGPYQWRLLGLLPSAPVVAWIEILRAVFRGHARDLRTEENVTRIEAEYLAVFEWLQDFYLNFAQFFLHMAYALALGLPFAIWCVFRVGFGADRVWTLLVLYALCGVLFVAGRIQSCTLWKAEAQLPKRPAQDGGRRIAVDKLEVTIRATEVLLRREP